ncbi:hypothetical protein NKR23_g9315 [Pleurostoma richardsiae]|uniref:Uncharacterized protein n=1 Tax=Pleurostoma richardsiae TaxID=41990 RepID=A0AA38VJQ7_9PEZI|nr:hypothetical protein NKR23_g9315 [Pleurostoma richardsiae]
MCIKKIFHNTYLDGERDRTELVETCRPGHMCAEPVVREYDRQIGCTKSQLSSSPHRANSPLSVANGRSNPYFSSGIHEHHLCPPTPRSPGYGSGSEQSDRERERRYRKLGPGIYVNDEKVMDLGGRASRRHERRSGADRVVVNHEPHTTLPPSPIPIPAPKLHRSTTMPAGNAFTADRHAERRRPIIIENSNRPTRRQSLSMKLADTLPHTSSQSQPHRYSSHYDADFLQPQSHRSRRSAEMYTVDDHERAERRRLRRESRPLQPASSSPNPRAAIIDPVLPADHIYGSSPHYGSSWGSSATANSGGNRGHVSPSPAAEAVKKELRWEDELRAAQNARIRARPKRASTMTPLQGEVRGILKTDGRARYEGQPLDMDGMDELYASLRGLSMEERERRRRERMQRHEEESREWEEQDHNTNYTDRLRNRFELPQRRLSAANKRRSEVFYPEDGRYKFM